MIAKHIVPVLSILALSSAANAQDAPARAPGAVPAESRVLLELTDRARGAQPEIVRLVVPMTADQPSRLATQIGAFQYRISVFREPRTGALRFEIHRDAPREASRHDVNLAVGVQARPGERAILARLQRPDGTETEIAATLAPAR